MGCRGWYGGLTIDVSISWEMLLCLEIRLLFPVTRSPANRSVLHVSTCSYYVWNENTFRVAESFSFRCFLRWCSCASRINSVKRDMKAWHQPRRVHQIAVFGLFSVDMSVRPYDVPVQRSIAASDPLVSRLTLAFSHTSQDERFIQGSNRRSLLQLSMWTWRKWRVKPRTIHPSSVCGFLATSLHLFWRCRILS